jgi:uncharacterized repeat protein (TIGR03803 family)
MKKLLLVFTIATANYLSAQNSIIAGITNAGGGLGYGTTYTYDPNTGNDTLLFSFKGNGTSILLGSPWGNMIQASNGKLYGMALYGGNWNGGGIFLYDPVTKITNVCASFDVSGYAPYGSLVQASNSLLYGMTSSGGAYNAGVILCYDPSSGRDSIVLDFNYSNGASPNGSLIQATNGLLYGMTSTGGDSDKGTVFSFDPVTGKDSIVVNLNNSTGIYPLGSLIQASNGLIYGMTPHGGSRNLGTMFYYNPVTGNDSVLINFNDTNGANPLGSLMQASNGLLYGMTQYGGYGQGVIFSYNITTGADSVLQKMAFYTTFPQGSFIQGNDGLLYATTSGGGSNSYGTIFSYDPVTGQDSILVSFTGMQNGDQPDADLVQATDGYLYGLVPSGGSTGAGVFYRLNTTTLQDTVIANFGIIQSNASNSPMLASNGLYYGMTYWGGLNNMGTFFSYNPLTNKDTVLVNFDGIVGSYPNGTLLQASDGNLYGMTSMNIFSYNPVNGKDSVLFNFDSASGFGPGGSLMQASNGLLYGTTSEMGPYNAGTLFSFNPVTGKDSVLVNFNDTNGNTPYCTLTEAPGGILYGMAFGGGYYGWGMLFSYSINSGIFDTLASMPYDCGWAQGNLIVDTASKTIYWASENGHVYGALCSYNMNTHVMDTLFDFNGSNGNVPTGSLMWDTTANLIYSTTYYGGTNNYGVLFRYNPVTMQDTTLFSFHDSIMTTEHRMRPGSIRNAELGINPAGITLIKSHSVITKVNNVAAKKEGIYVYPNPVSNAATVIFSSVEKHYLELDDVTGKKIQSIECNGTSYRVNCEGLSPGVYFITSHNEGNPTVSSVKIVIE